MGLRSKIADCGGRELPGVLAPATAVAILSLVGVTAQHQLALGSSEPEHQVVVDLLWF